MAEKTVLQPPPPRALTDSNGKVSAHFYQWLQSMQQGVSGLISGAFTEASAANYQANTAGALALTPETVWAATAYTALTDGATIAVDMATGVNFNVSIAADRALGNPTNAKVGQSGCFKVTASGGARNLTVGGNYKKTADIAFPVNIASGQTAYVFYFVDTSSRILITAVLNNPT